ncbi:MAG: Helix-turn-helix domain protein [Neobacillus sp.]|nr:Helix-turn-helix domain protein [Neobacillus sp.]
MSNSDFSFGDFIKSCRRSLKLTQKETAKHAHISKSYLSSIENNKVHNPSPSVLKNLAQALSINEEQLFLLLDSNEEIKNGRFNTVGDFISYRRKRKGFQQVDLAKRSGLTSGYISQIENNIKTPRMRTLKKLATALDISDKELLMYADKDIAKKEVLLVDVTGLEKEDIDFLMDQLNYLKKRAKRNN